MAKVQGKKASAGGARRAARKVAAKARTAAGSAKKQAAKRAAAVVKPARKAAKKVATKASRVARTVKTARAVKPPAKPPAAKATRRSSLKPAAVPPAPPKAPVAAKVPAVPKPAEPKKPRARKSRPRVHSNGAPVAAWLPQGEKPRPSSFIPAPARAEAPSLIAAPPASSDRLIRPEDVTEFVTRTVPIRVDIEQTGGRVYIGVNPEEVALRVGEGIEWDFRYFAGADVTVDEVVIEFEKPAPFSGAAFRSRKPGTARPHRQLSGAAQKAVSGTRVGYTIRALNAFKTELGVARSYVTVGA